MKALKKTLVPGITTFAAFLALLAPPALSSTGFLDDEEEGAEEEQDEDEDTDKWFAIVGGDVHTGTGAVLRGATVLSKNGKIKEIGYDLFLPEATETLDATGYRVYPGLVAVSGSTRISRGMFGAAEMEDDLSHAHDHSDGSVTQGGGSSDPLHPDDDWQGAFDRSFADDSAYEANEVDAGFDEEAQTAAKRDDRPDFEHSFDPFSSYLVMALSAGITTAEQSGTAAKLKRGEIDGVAMKEDFTTNFSWSSSGRRSLREKFERASEWLREMEVFQEKSKKDKDLKEPDKRGVDDNVVAVLTGRKLAKFRADSRADLLGIARFAQQYRFRPLIDGCREGWTVAEELGRAGAYAIVTPRDRRPKDERLLVDAGSSIENAAILHKHGVQVAIIPSNNGFDLSGITGRDLLHFPVEAAFAVRGGMSNEAALEGITMVPARILGVDHRVGSLEVGKDMDAIVTDGDVLHYQTFVQWTVVDGKLVYDKQDELLFHHIRPRPEPEPEEVVEVDAEAEPEQPEEEVEEADDDGDDEGDEEGDDEEGDEDEEPEGDDGR